MRLSMDKVSLQSRFPSNTLLHSWTLHEGREGLLVPSLVLDHLYLVEEGGVVEGDLLHLVTGQLRSSDYAGSSASSMPYVRENCKVEWKVS